MTKLRDNIRQSLRDSSVLRFMPGMGWTEVVRVLIITNVAVFALQEILQIQDTLALNFGLVPRLFFAGKIWQVFTYMFLHGGIGHIFFNMLALWMFGSMLEREWGSREFAKYYLLTGLGGGLCYALFNIGSPIPTVGASGAIYGLLAAYAIIFPDNIIYVWFVIPLKAKWFALIFGAVEFFSSFNTGSGVAHLAHLGGMVIGYLYLKRAKFMPSVFKSRHEREHDTIRKRWQEEHRLDEIRREVDDLLEKVSRVGFDGLTRSEQKRLERASAILREKERLD
ncbi:rhomboid family intramembrane serine protease [candidate division KSB1 bacterium]|nr:rhomboid family intramembrane serine protease [candidate division KSB1 bacterium]